MPVTLESIKEDKGFYHVEIDKNFSIRLCRKPLNSIHTNCLNVNLEGELYRIPCNDGNYTVTSPTVLTKSEAIEATLDFIKYHFGEEALDHRSNELDIVSVVQRAVKDLSPTHDELVEVRDYIYTQILTLIDNGNANGNVLPEIVQTLVDEYGQRRVLNALIESDGSTDPSHELGIEDLTAIIEMCTKRINEMSE